MNDLKNRKPELKINKLNKPQNEGSSSSVLVLLKKKINLLFSMEEVEVNFSENGYSYKKSGKIKR